MLNITSLVSLLIFLTFALIACGPAQLASSTTTPDPEIGRQLFNKGFLETSGRSCHYCHKVTESEISPQVPLIGIAAYAGERVEGMSAEEYLRQSILDPPAYLVEGFSDAMPTNYAEILSEEDINQLIAYLMTLK